MTTPEVTIIDTAETIASDQYLETAPGQRIETFNPSLSDIYGYLMSIDRRLTVMESAAADLTKFIEGFSMPPMLAKMFGPKHKPVTASDFPDADR